MQTNQHFKQSDFHSSLKKRIGIVACCLLLVIIGISLLTYLPDDITRTRMNSALTKSVPTSWKLITKSADPSGFFGTCGPLLDTPCPQVNAHYRLPSSRAYISDLQNIEETLKKMDFKTQSCISRENCVNYYLNAKHGGISISIVVDKKDTSSADVHIQKS